MKICIDNIELDTRISLNYNRLSTGSYYSIDEIFAPQDYDWQGDKEGRALLAFVSHYKISGKKIDAMDSMIALMPGKLNPSGYLGPIYSDEVHEQQLSGHSWLLRGLCEYYEQFKDSSVLSIINSITNSLFLPAKSAYQAYPVSRTSHSDGDVCGSVADSQDGWILSSDIGCAFMAIDGLTHVYKITNNPQIKELLDLMIKVFMSVDKLTLKVQTHCTLTAARGMMLLHSLTGDKYYLECAQEIFDLYTNKGGMTYTYQNLNWWGRPDSWTEPCAIVDSLILASELYKATGSEIYRQTAARIYHNGFSTLQRSNGGAGTDTLICEGSGETHLKAKMYEAYFCCTMRLAEGLWYIKENKDMLYAQTKGSVTKNDQGIYTDGDIIYALPEGGFEKYAKDTADVDGLKLCPIIKCYQVDDETLTSGGQQIIFR